MNSEKTIKKTLDCYIGIKRCGCVVAACVNMPGCDKETAKSVADWIKRGWTVERVSRDEFKRLKECGCAEKIKSDNRQRSIF